MAHTTSLTVVRTDLKNQKSKFWVKYEDGSEYSIPHAPKDYLKGWLMLKKVKDKSILALDTPTEFKGINGMQD